MGLRIPVDARLWIAVALAVTVLVLAFLLPRPPEPLGTAPTTGAPDAPVQGSAQPGITLATLAQHTTQEDCWIAVRGNVYDVTAYINIHPGGRARIIGQCGKDATRAFETRGGDGSHSSRAWNLLTGFIVGPLEGAQGAAVSGPAAPSAPSGPALVGDVEAIIQARYPGATILDLDEEDDGRVEAKIAYEGRTIEVKIDADGTIQEDD